jgi:hypothetical protein
LFAEFVRIQPPRVQPDVLMIGIPKTEVIGRHTLNFDSGRNDEAVEERNERLRMFG